jgi:hypothetical protein
MVKDNLTIIDDISIKDKIFVIRNTQLMIDKDLAELFGTTTKAFNQAVNRNIDRFPSDFRFQLNETEKNELVTNCDRFKTLKHSTSNPYAFTEQGVSMLSAILRSDIAVETSIKIIREFVTMRKFISQNNYLFQRMDILEEKQKNTDQKVDEILNAIESKNTTIKQGVFFEGQFFDAYIFISDILKNAKKSITLVDNYIDEKTLLHLASKTNKDIKISIITKSISKELKLDIEKYNKQNNNLSIYEYKNSHDRFLILDNKIIYHLGASIKDLGSKWFAFSKLEDDNLELLGKVNNILEGKH